MNGLYRVHLRRGARFPLKLGAEQLDGKVYRFRFGWQLTHEDGGRYAGEAAMVSVPDDPEYPYPENELAPIWLPIGDLVRAETPAGDLVEQAAA